MNYIKDKSESATPKSRHNYKFLKVSIVIASVVLFVLVIYFVMSVVPYIPNDNRGYGVNVTSSVEVFDTSNNGAAMNPLIINSYINTISGDFSLILANANISVYKILTIIGTNFVTISTGSGNIIANSADSPLTIYYDVSNPQWLSTVNMFPLNQNNPSINGELYKRMVVGASMAANDEYIFTSTYTYNNGNGAVIIWKISELLAGVTTPYRIIEGNQESGTGFGFEVVVKGNYLLVGAMGVNSGKGASVIYKYNGVDWDFRARVQGNVGVTPTYELQSYAGPDISADGSVVVLGAPVYNNYNGRVYVFKYNVVKQIYEQRDIIETPAAGIRFGFSTALSDDGNTLIVGSDNGAGTGYIFEYNNTTWVQVYDSTMIPAGGTTPYVSIDAAGTTAVFSTVAISAYVVNKVAGVWSLTTTLIPSFPAGNFLAKKSISADGTLVVISAPDIDGQAGGMFVFELSGGIWTETYQFTGIGTIGISRQSLVGITLNKNYIAIGGPADANNSGAVWINSRIANNLDQTKLIYNNDLPTRVATVYVGDSVQISPDASFMITDVYGAIGGENAFIYSRTGNSWQFASTLFSPDNITLSKPRVGISSNGNVAIVSDYSRELVYIYRKTIKYTANNAINIIKTVSWNIETTLLAPVAVSEYGKNICINPDGNTIVVSAPAFGGIVGNVYVYNYIGGNWIMQDIPNPAPALSNLQFGFQITISPNGLTLAIVVLDFTNPEILYNICIYSRSSITGLFIYQTTILVSNISFRAPLSLSLAYNAPNYILAFPSNANTNVDDTVRIYTGSNAVWTLQSTIIRPVGEAFGDAVSLADNGKEIAIGAPIYSNQPNVVIGATYIYKTADYITWTLIKQLLPQNSDILSIPAIVNMGTSVSISASGGILACGAPGETFEAGTVFIFS